MQDVNQIPGTSSILTHPHTTLTIDNDSEKSFYQTDSQKSRKEITGKSANNEKKIW